MKQSTFKLLPVSDLMHTLLFYIFGSASEVFDGRGQHATHRIQPAKQNR